ncbi:hypothetical protein [Desulfovibrio inopinatus]|uniref:hypothetical protein n=1 Tax=Desulfovibrio inopinatus TaxID=102109 RepID=UPI0004832F0C|nr:hypothetical protein [Desulfovibrio inopinatus]
MNTHLIKEVLLRKAGRYIECGMPRSDAVQRACAEVTNASISHSAGGQFCLRRVVGGVCRELLASEEPSVP